MKTDVTVVAKNAIRQFGEPLHPEAVCIFTPFVSRTSLASCKVSKPLAQFLVQYEPKVETEGLFPHQAAFFEAYIDGGTNFITTTATGSGKSLCFWGWVFDRLGQKPDATALLCFPTKALMWGQAERLARISKSLAYPGDQETAYSGTVKFGKQPIGWTIWHGTGKPGSPTYDPVMGGHEKTEAFKSARIRIATIDKAHYNLFTWHENKKFASHLSSLVLDEAHTYDGVFGANVHFFLKRLYMASEIMGQKRPGLFLASATLASAKKFATTLVSLEDESEIVHIEDSTKQQITLIPTVDVPKLLSRPPKSGLLRVVLLLNDMSRDVPLVRFMSDDKQIGQEVNTIYFSQSKFTSRRLKDELDRNGKKRTCVVYDADLPPKDRREMERNLNDPSVRGVDGHSMDEPLPDAHRSVGGKF